MNEPTTPGRLTRLAPYALLGVTLLAIGLASWRPVPGGVWHDDGVYLVIGKALAQGDGLVYAGVPGVVPAVKFPPLYPTLLGGLWLLFDGIRPVVLAAVFLNLLFLAGSGALLAWVLERGAGLPRTVALGTVLVAYFSADVWRLALVTLSEPLFVLLAAGALAAWPLASRDGDRTGAAILSVLLAAAVLTRSAGAALVAGFAVALLRARGPKAGVGALALPVATAVLWGSWTSAHAGEIPEGFRDILGPYWPWLVEQLTGTPGAFAAALPGHAWAVGLRLSRVLVPGLDGWLLAAAILPAGVLVVAGLVLMHRRFPPLPWVVAAYGCMLLAWPFADRRLIAPIHPLLVASAGLAVLEAWRRFPDRRARGTVGTIAFLLAGTVCAVGGARVSSGWAASPYRLRSVRLAAAVEALRNTAPPEAVIGAPEYWAALHLHGGWAAGPSARFAPRAEDVAVPIWGSPDQQLALWWDAGYDHILLEQSGRIHGDTLDRLEAVCPGAVGILATFPPQMLVRLSWDAACAADLGVGD